MPFVHRKDLENWLNKYLDIYTTNDYLPNGLQVEGTDKIYKAVVAVSINMDVIDRAIQEKAQAIIVHHGLFWKTDDPRITAYRKSRINALLQNEINLFAYHLPLDLHPDISHNRLILNGLGIKDDWISAPQPGTGVEYGLIGDFEISVDFSELVKRLNKTLECKAKYFKYGRDEINRVVVVSGAGRTLLDKVISLGIDTYITGDVQENTEYICREMKINYVYAGHYNTEKPGIIALGNRVRDNFGIEVVFIEQKNEL